METFYEVQVPLITIDLWENVTVIYQSLTLVTSLWNTDDGSVEGSLKILQADKIVALSFYRGEP